jgi:hypothetical protein
MKNLLFAFVMLTFISVAFAQDGSFHLDQEYDISKTGKIDISTSDARVFITGSNRSKAHVKIDRVVTTRGWNATDGFKVEVTAADGNLNIREYQTGPTVSVGYFHEDYKIEIEVPDGVSLTVRGDDGDYFVKQIHGSIKMSLDDADAELTGCNGNEFDFRFDDGDLRMDQGKGSITVRADDADIEIYKGEFSTIDAEVDDGDFIVETSLADNGTYNINSEDGSIHMKVTGGGGNFDVSHDDATFTFTGNFRTVEASDERTRLSLYDGTANVMLKADDASVRLTANH